MKDSASEEELLKSFSTNYNCIPTTVFSPTEYSFVGLTEEDAIAMHGEDNIEVYHREVVPLEYSIYKHNDKTAYLKVITMREGEQRVIGIHYFGPTAEEVIAGLALGMKLGMTKRDLDFHIGIHPSVSEDFYNLDITKRSKKDFRKTEC